MAGHPPFFIMSNPDSLQGLKCRKKMADKIFQRSYINLKNKERNFVEFQVSRYRKYVRFIREKALPIMDRKKFRTREYKLIEDLFLRNIPLFCIKTGMEKCLERARASGKPIFSLAFFKSDILGEFRRHLKMMQGGRFFSDPWGFQEWKENENGKK